MLSFAIYTLGCKVNAFESESYSFALRSEGFEEVDFLQAADIYIINTCAVTNTAAAKSRQKINQALKQNPRALICVIGCLIQTGDDSILNNPKISVLIGSDQKQKLLPIIKEALSDRQRHNLSSAIDHPLQFENLKIENFHHQTRAYLKIQDGCNQFCTYCIIPYARGRERSMPKKEVLEHAARFIENGHKEIVLAGIHTGRYGRDQGTDLNELLTELTAYQLKRLRLSSIEINEVTDDIIKLFQEQPCLARHLHIPLQAGSDRILQLMRRPYDTEYYAERLTYIRSKIPGIAISTDIIAGFPTETDIEFQSTLNFARDMGFSFIHAFPFSRRDGTKAALFNPQISESDKKQRIHELLNLSGQLTDEYQISLVGKRVEVIFESFKNGLCFGHSSEYVPVYIKSNADLRRKMYNVRVINYQNKMLIGNLEEEIK
ncbi:MAG: tRNA (N(6)-L-threonylcarbamoyladenosine(37)-C(2))-methylthiotransferase MtaB [Erysipelotrichaceae bacterium]|nr:tRNA (N(6)-L-threonylcarbamoyladenosine(37)-C(2))-methylthiotransferase MtaB [Erysipelotrichaceae bacterium]